MKDEEVHCNNWPISRITEPEKSGDGQVRKAQVEIIREGKEKTFLRPIKELILLVPGAPDHPNHPVPSQVPWGATSVTSRGGGD